MNIQVIFQVHSMHRGPSRWVDYCREQSPHSSANPTNNWAKGECDRLEREHDKPFRFVLEFWN